MVKAQSFHISILFGVALILGFHFSNRGNDPLFQDQNSFEDTGKTTSAF